jgi:hypothetical protein
MKVLIQVALCSTLFLGVAAAQHRGGGGGGGGSRGSMGGGSHIGGGSIGRGYGGGGVGSYGFRGGYGNSGSRGGYGNLGFRGGYGYGFRGYGFGYGYPYYGYGLGLGYGFGYPYYGYYGSYYDYPSYYPDTSYYSQPAYQPTQDANVIYAPAQPAAPMYANPGAPASRGYDQYGQQLQSSGGAYASGSPIYLIALKNHNIIAASSYSVNGGTLQYVTLDHAEKQVTLDELDRDLTQRLNRERHVPFQLPQQ